MIRKLVSAFKNCVAQSPLHPPLLGHIHIPKTAGSSFRRLLDEHYGAAHLHLYSGHNTAFVYPTSQLESLLQPPEVRAFSSHFVRRFPSTIHKRRVYYVTFLRNPLQQFISYLTYTRKHYAEIQEPVLLSHLPPEMPDLSIRDCARWILTESDKHFRNFQENYNTNFFARYAMADALGLTYSDSVYRRFRLDVARQVLSKFLLVGISERMDESWALLQRRASRVGIELRDARVPFDNVTAAEREPLDWLHPKDEVGSLLLASVKEDTALYQWGLAQFESKCRALLAQRQRGPVYQPASSS